MLNENFSNEIPPIHDPEIAVEGEGEEGIDDGPTLANAELTSETLDVYEEGMDEIDAEEDAVVAEIESSGLPPQEAAQKIDSVSKRSMAGKVATFFAVLGAGLFAQQAQAGTLRDIFIPPDAQQAENASRRSTSNRVQIESKQGKLAIVVMKRDAVADEIRSIYSELAPEADEVEQTPEAPDKAAEARMDAEYKKAAAELRIDRLTKEEALEKEEGLSPAMRKARTEQIEAENTLALIQLAEKFNAMREGGNNTNQSAAPEKAKVLSPEDQARLQKLRIEYIKLNSQANQLAMQIDGKRYQSNMRALQDYRDMKEKRKRDRQKKQKQKERDAR